MSTNGHRPFDNLLHSNVPVPAWWTSRLDLIYDFLDAEVDPEQVRTLAVSPGGRAVRAAFYGEAEPHLRGRANYNSALGAQDPNAYCRRGERKHPVLMILAGVHGAEVEGMIAALSAISILETGIDQAGHEQPDLAGKLRRLRLIIIPVANPDGRARVPYDGWVGLPTAEMHRVGQGTRCDGTSYGWPGCKAVHPMTGDVGGLGGYFDDAGVNLMHDEWAAPMSDTTRALLRLVHEEAPDMVLNCHSHESPPAVLYTPYVPQATKESIAAFASLFYANLDAVGLAHHTSLPDPRVDGPAGQVPPSFNLTSMLYHGGTALPMTFESPHGLANGPVAFTYEQILQVYHVLLATAADRLLKAMRG
jgi:hypothetical protein